MQDDDALSRLEADLLRPAARASHELAMSRHALVARPLWESVVDYLPAVNAIAYCGAADLQKQLAAALAPRGLAVLDTQRMKHHGQVRWDALNRSHVAFFDLRGASDIAALAADAPKCAREVATAPYELGIAFALGKPVVVAGAEGGRCRSRSTSRRSSSRTTVATRRCLSRRWTRRFTSRNAAAAARRSATA